MVMWRVFSEGREANCDIQMCQVWRGALCWSKLFWRLPYKDQLVRHYLSVLRTNSWSLDHNVSKRTWIFTSSFKNLSSPLRSKDITAFLRHSEQCLFSSPQNAFCFTNLSHLVLEIFRFFEYHAQNLNTPQKNSASWDLQLGFNSAFKGLIAVVEKQH